MWCMHTAEYYSALKKEILTHATAPANPEDIKPDTGGSILYDLTDTRFPAHMNAQRWKGIPVGQGLEEGDGELVLNGDRVSL